MQASITMGGFLTEYTERIVSDYTRIAYPEHWEEEALELAGITIYMDKFMEDDTCDEDTVQEMKARRAEVSEVLANIGSSTSEQECKKRLEAALDFLEEIHALICGVRQKSRNGFYRTQIWEDDRPNAILKAKCLSMAAFHKEITPQEMISMATAELELAQRVNKINGVAAQLGDTWDKSWPGAKLDLMLETLDSGAILIELYAMYNHLYIEKHPKSSENVIPSVETLVNDMEKAWRTLRKMLSRRFGYPGSVMLINMSEMVARHVENERVMHTPLGSSVLNAHPVEKMNLQCMF